MNLNYEKIYKNILQKSKKNDIMEMDGFTKQYEDERNLPEAVRGNAEWVKEIYKELEQRPAIGMAEKQKKANLISDFTKEADSIFKLDRNNRESDLLKSYMQNKYLGYYNIAKHKDESDGINQSIIASSNGNLTPKLEKSSLQLLNYKDESEKQAGNYKTSEIIREEEQRKADDEKRAAEQRRKLPLDLDWDRDGRVDTAEDQKRFDPDNDNIAAWNENMRTFLYRDDYSYRNVKYLDDVPYEKQSGDLCAMASAAMVLGALTGKKYDNYSLFGKYKTYTSERNMSEDRNMRKVCSFLNDGGLLDNFPYKANLHNKLTYEEIKSNIDNGLPVIISYDEGESYHAVVVVGYADNNGKGTRALVVQDPSKQHKGATKTMLDFDGEVYGKAISFSKK